jgi:hypothetical protein
MNRRIGARVVVIVLALGAITARAAHAQTYARFAVPDSALEGAIRSAGPAFENLWNALVVAELRASLAHADSATRLFGLERRIAEAEPGATGSRIARDAIELRTRWTREQRVARVRAAVAESLAALAQGARDFDRADSLYTAAIAGYQRVAEKRRVATLLGTQGNVALTAGDAARADTLYRAALVARRALGDERMIGNVLNALGSAEFILRHYADAQR